MKPRPETGGDESPLPPEHGEQRRTYQPRIYVACLASYNNAILHGLWIDAQQTVDELLCDITAMLDSSPLAGAEEWAIHNHDGFAGFEPHEYEDLEVISRMANGVSTYGEAFSAYTSWAGTSEDALAAFRNHYMGTYESTDAWAQNLWHEHEFDKQIDEFVDPRARRYITINYEQFIRDMASDWHIIDGQDGTHVFTP